MSAVTGGERAPDRRMLVLPRRRSLLAVADVDAKRYDMDINDNAPVVTRDAITIQAPLDTIWRIQTDVVGWPAWQPEVERAEGPFPLQAGDSFTWLVAGLDIVSTVQEIDPPRRIVWGGPAQGIIGVHVWTFEDTEHGVLVTTRESWEGPRVADAPEAAQAALDASLHDWLENLKKRAENDH